MKSYQEMLQEYRKRRHDSVVDVLATGLTYTDELAVEMGVLEESGILAELTDTVTGALPFVLIAVTEGSKVILGRKPMKTGAADGAYRMLKTGAALGVGGAVLSAAGLWAALPASMGVRALFDRYKSRALTGLRVQSRIDRLHELNAHIRSADLPEDEGELLPAPSVPADGAVV